MSDIYKGELQDYKGNTVYNHTEADVVFCADGESVQKKIAKQEAALGSVTGTTDSLEVSDSNILATSKTTNELAQMQGGNILTYNESEDAYYIQHGADSVPKKLGSGGIVIPEITLTGTGAGYKTSSGSGSGSIKINVEEQTTFTVRSVSGTANIQIDGGTDVAIEEGISYDISEASEIVIKVFGYCGISHPDGAWCSNTYTAKLYDVVIS